MNRWLGSVSLVSAVVVVVIALAGTSIAAEYATVGDDFDAGGYDGSVGAVGAEWVGPWNEVGEGDGPNAGNVVVASSGCSGSCLTGYGALAVGTLGAKRTASFSGAGVASISYAAEFDGVALAVLDVQVSRDGGPWTTVSVERLDTHRTMKVGTVGGTLGIRFLFEGLGIGGEIRIDDVVVTVAPTATTPTVIDLPIPSITIPPIPIVTTTTAAPVGSTSTTTDVVDRTTTTRPQSPSTTEPPGRSTTTTAVGTVLPSSDDSGGADGRAATGGATQPRMDGVMMDLDPGLGPDMAGYDADEVVESLDVPFGVRSEDLSLDLTLYVLLGLALAGASALRLEGRRTTGS